MMITCGCFVTNQSFPPCIGTLTLWIWWRMTSMDRGSLRPATARLSTQDPMRRTLRIWSTLWLLTGWMQAARRKNSFLVGGCSESIKTLLWAPLDLNYLFLPIGIPLYGRAWTLRGNDITIGSPGTPGKPGPYAGASGMLSYAEVS